MRLQKSGVLAIIIGLSTAEREQALHKPGLRRQDIQNVSSIPYSLATFTSPSFSNALSGTAPTSQVHSPFPTGYVVSGNSSIPFRPTGTGAAPAAHHGLNGSCGQPTLNVLDASLDYWYTSTVYNAVSTFSIQFNSDDSPTGWTLLPASTPFDLSSALGEATPVAASTTVITQTAFSSPNATTGKGQIPNVIVTPPPASITVPSYSTTFSSSNAAFVHFDKYEIISQTTPAYGDQPGSCVAVTKTHTLETPFAFPYNGPSSNFSGAGVTGDVNPAFLGVVGQSFAVAGSWKAAPTMAIVVQKVFAAEAVLAASIEATQKSLLVPSATLPSFLSPIHPKTTKDELPNGNPKGHTETTASFLLVPTPAPTKTGNSGSEGGNGPRATPTAEPQGGAPNMVPFVAHLEHSDTTLLVPTPGTTEVITTQVEGLVVTATRGPAGNRPGNGGGGGGGSTGTVKVGAVDSTPTNAVQVLSEALASAKDSKPTATGGNQGGAGSHDSNGDSGRPVPVIVVGQRTFTGDSQTRFSLQESKTLTPGGTADVGGTSLSLLIGGSSVVINGHTKPVSTAVVTPAPAITIGPHVYHATGGSTYVIRGQTLTPGGVISVGGTFVSLAPGLSTVVINGKTQPLGATKNPSPAITSPPVLTIGGRQYAAINSGTTYVINGKTLTAGDEETVSIRGKTYIVSLAPGATVLRIETFGPNGEVTATMFETLYPAGSQATETSIISACSTSAASKLSATSPAKSTGPAASLQNGASSSSPRRAAVAFSVSMLALIFWI